jgi:hypothetical protein
MSHTRGLDKQCVQNEHMVWTGCMFICVYGIWINSVFKINTWYGSAIQGVDKWLLKRTDGMIWSGFKENTN